MKRTLEGETTRGGHGRGMDTGAWETVLGDGLAAGEEGKENRARLGNKVLGTTAAAAAHEHSETVQVPLDKPHVSPSISSICARPGTPHDLLLLDRTDSADEWSDDLLARESPLLATGVTPRPCPPPVQPQPTRSEAARGPPTQAELVHQSMSLILYDTVRRGIARRCRTHGTQDECTLATGEAFARLPRHWRLSPLLAMLETHILVPRAAFHLAFIYLDRALEQEDDADATACDTAPGWKTTDIERGYLLSLLAAAKMLQDMPIRNRDWATVFGISPALLFAWERTFLRLSQYKMHVSVADFAEATADTRLALAAAMGLDMEASRPL